MSNSDSSKSLRRTLSLSHALAIGIGTMVGAGVFVFPGIAIGYAGPAAILSFAIAGFIALLVALCTAELATAMPKSGGAYFFVSRSMGPAFGMFVGMGQWFGLVFASSFYLVGFGYYAVELLKDFGFRPGDPEVLIATGGGVFLTILNIIGTKKVGKFQNLIVVALSGILSLLFIYGIIESTSLIGDRREFHVSFAPEGIWPVFTTVGLIFTSYLGFVQIATVAGEIKNPSINLPRALIGSVVIVMLLYVAAIYVTILFIPAEELSDLDEFAIAQVAENIIGKTGGTVVLFAALLATLSSANASILSSSRTVYALNKDKMIPGVASKVNEKFGTPHIAILMVGVPISVFALLGELEVLAEVASLLHLVFYGLICVSLLILRKKKPLWFVPTYSTPAGNLIPILGAITCFGLIFMMRKESLIIGISILVIATLWYFFYARERNIQRPVPPHVVPQLREPFVLLTSELPDPTPPPYPLLQAFRSLKLFVLGYRVSPEQTDPQQSEDELDAETKKQFEQYLDDISFSSIDVDSQFIYTADFPDLLNSYLEEENVQALLIPKEMNELNRLLVPVYRSDQINVRLATILRELSEDGQIPISLFFVTEEESSEAADDTIERLKLKAFSTLRSAGISKSRIKSNQVAVEDIKDAVIQISSEDDLIVMSESKDDERERWFKSIHENIRDNVKSPVLMIFQEVKTGHDTAN